MSQHSYIAFASTAFLPLLAHATPFSIYEARSFAMGGAGVAASQYAAAAVFNPALLAIKADSDHFSLILPAVGADASGNEGAVNAVQDVQDHDSLNALQNAANSFTTAYNACKASGCNNNPALRSASAQVAQAATTVQSDMIGLSGKTYLVGGGALTALAFPKWQYKMALSINVEGFGRVTPNIVAKDLSDIGDVITGARNYANTGQPAALTTFIDANGNIKVGSTTSAYQSSLKTLGVAMADVGLSLARQFGGADSGFLLGITPKIQKVRTVAYTANVDQTDFQLDKNQTNSSSVNLDLGLAKTFGPGSLENVRLGLMVRNLMSHTYKTTDPTQEVKVSPQVRAGASWSGKRATLTTDLDLTANKQVGSDTESSQFFAMGGELDAWILKLRAGYRQDIKAKYGALTGGLSIFGVQVSGIYAKDREAGVAVQFGGSF